MQPQSESIFPSDTGPSPLAQFMLNLLIGLILLVPFVNYAARNRLLPALDTIRSSQYEINVLGRESTYVGMDNYAHMTDDEVLSQALGYTITLLVGRLLVVAFVPPIVGLLLGAQGLSGRFLARLILAVVGAVASPVALSMLWALFWGQLWGREPSPLYPPPENLLLGSQTGAVNSTLLLDMLITLGIAVAVGAAAYMAVMRGRRAGSSTGSAFMGVWLVGALLAGASAFQSFIVPYIVTNGGPARSTTSLTLYLFDNAFRFFNLGYGEALSALLIYGSILVAFFVWLFITTYNLRLRFVAASGGSGGGCGSTFGIPLLLLAALPVLGLVAWGQGLLANSGAASGVNTVGADVNQTLRNGLEVPLRTIWLMQIPITYLAGLSLGFIRPLGRLTNLAFLALLATAFIPVEALTISWFLQARDRELLNTLDILGQPWVVSGAALIVFKLFFDGARESYDESLNAGQAREAALLRTVLLPSLPLAALVGAVLSFAAAQSLWWPLIVTVERSMYSTPQYLAAMRATSAGNTDALLAATMAFITRIALVVAPVFAVLLVALDRLAILGGQRVKPLKRPPTDPTASMVQDATTTEFGADMADIFRSDLNPR